MAAFEVATHGRFWVATEEVLGFYQSPLGQKLLSAAPELMTESRPTIENKVKELYPRITSRVLERLKKEGFPLR